MKQTIFDLRITQDAQQTLTKLFHRANKRKPRNKTKEIQNLQMQQQKKRQIQTLQTEITRKKVAKNNLEYKKHKKLCF